jgi:hypothetical protein
MEASDDTLAVITGIKVPVQLELNTLLAFEESCSEVAPAPATATTDDAFTDVTVVKIPRPEIARTPRPLSLTKDAAVLPAEVTTALA